MPPSVRIRRSHLQTPTRSWVHPDRGRRIAVVGTWHVGQPHYYTRIRAVIDRLAATGALVHCERVTVGPAPADATEDEAYVYALEHHRAQLAAEHAAGRGWITQSEAMPTAPGWCEVDLDPRETLRQMGMEVMHRRLHHQIQGLEADDQHRWRSATAQLRTNLGIRLASRFGRRVRRSTDPVLLDRREQVALDALDATTADLVLVWGVHHLPGLETGLRGRGYRPTPAAWHTVGRIPGILGILADLVRGLARRSAARGGPTTSSWTSSPATAPPTLPRRSDRPGGTSARPTAAETATVSAPSPGDASGRPRRVHDRPADVPPTNQPQTPAASSGSEPPRRQS